MLGRQLEDLFPLAFLPKNHALAVAIMSYNGGLDYGLLGDYDALPDIDVIADGIDASLKELLDAARTRAASNGAEKSRREREVARRRREARNGGPTKILPAAGPRSKQGPAADMRAKRTKRAGRAPGEPGKLIRALPFHLQTATVSRTWTI